MFQTCQLEVKEEYRFDPNRGWKFDFAFPSIRLAVEIEGGEYALINGNMSGHLTPQGFKDDCLKYNIAQLRGWCVLRFPGSDIQSGYAIGFVESAIEALQDPIVAARRVFSDFQLVDEDTILENH